MAEPRDARQVLESLWQTLERRVREEPYATLALATMAGYVAGGGLFSRFTRPLARAAMGALLVPEVRERLRESTGDRGRVEVAGAV